MFFGGEDFTTVDIGSHSIKLLRFRQRKGQLTILQKGKIHLPYQTIINGGIEDSAIIAQKIDELLKELNFRPGKVITTIPNNSLIIRNIEMPFMPEAELAEALKWEVSDYLPFSMEEAVIDYKILAKEDEKLQVLLIAAKKAILDDFLNPFRKIGLKPSVINIQPMALLSLLEYQGELSEDPVAIIDLGASSTRVVIGNKKTIFLSRNIDSGGQEFTKMIMEDEQLDYLKAEEYKMDQGMLGDGNLELELIRSIASPALGIGAFYASIADELAKEIARSLDYYSRKHSERQLAKIYYTGGGSKLKGLIDYISQEINGELTPLDPFKGFEQSSEEIEYAVALGLGVSEVLKNEG